MSPRAAKIISRLLLVIAVSGLLASLLVATLVYPRQQPGQIVVIGDPSEGDGPATLADLRDRQASEDDPFRQTVSIGFLVIITAISLTWLVTGSLIVSRQPKNTSGWIFSAIGTAAALTLLPQVLVTTGAKVDPGSVPLLGLWASLGEYTFLVVTLIPLLFLLYPDGRPPSHRWRIVEYTLFAALGAIVIGSLIAPGPLNTYVDQGVLYMNPLGIASMSVLAPTMIALGTVVTLAISLATVFAVRGRYKRSTGDERQQLRWLVFVATLVGSLLLLDFVVGTGLFFILKTDLPVFAIGFALFALSVAVGVPGSYLLAMYRYRLYDLDLVVKKAVVFALVVGAVVMLYLLIAVAVPIAVLGVGSGLQVGGVLIGIMIGLLVFPVRARAKRFADRIVYGQRATPYEVLTSFSGRVGETYATEDVLARMAQFLAQGVGADAARVWLRVGTSLRPEAAWPADTTPGEAIFMQEDQLPTLPGEDVVPVRHDGQILGALSVRMPASDPMTPAKERLVTDLAEQAGLVLNNVRLIEDLRASRQRLVSAQDQERRKLERNIHDGAQQQLVALSVQLKLLQTVIARDPEKASAMAAQLQERSTEALEDLRDLARGIYPPLLADQGLAAALGAQARKAAVPVTVDADGVKRYIPDVEATAYFCVLEALNNIAKYANASRADVTITHSDGHLTFAVVDDGAGFDAKAKAYGTGLQGMRDRLESIGGTLRVASAPGRGTTVTGSVPASPAAP
ncbi:MAG: hypothetical protein QOI60_628 [Actinomycetota bacterium]|nr:hypothetical protein [Actinomycetota bacterium]